MIRMNRELESSLTKLMDMQAPNGGFVWFKGGADDRYMTQYIVTGIGHLKKLGALSKSHEQKIKKILSSAIPYLDKRVKEDYDYLVKHKVNLVQNHLGYIAVHYLYMRSFFLNMDLPVDHKRLITIIATSQKNTGLAKANTCRHS